MSNHTSIQNQIEATIDAEISQHLVDEHIHNDVKAIISADRFNHFEDDGFNDDLGDFIDHQHSLSSMYG